MRGFIVSVKLLIKDSLATAGLPPFDVLCAAESAKMMERNDRGCRPAPMAEKYAAVAPTRLACLQFFALNKKDVWGDGLVWFTCDAAIAAKTPKWVLVGDGGVWRLTMPPEVSTPEEAVLLFRCGPWV